MRRRKCGENIFLPLFSPKGKRRVGIRIRQGRKFLRGPSLNPFSRKKKRARWHFAYVRSCIFLSSFSQIFAKLRRRRHFVCFELQITFEQGGRGVEGFSSLFAQVDFTYFTEEEISLFFPFYGGVWRVGFSPLFFPLKRGEGGLRKKRRHKSWVRENEGCSFSHRVVDTEKKEVEKNMPIDRNRSFCRKLL